MSRAQTTPHDVPRGYRYDWSLFEDWCAAFGYEPCPASPLALARFLDAHPAARATQLRRIAAINAMHTEASLPVPGRAQVIREQFSIRARARKQRADQARTVIPTLPTCGWPYGLFGRRDALLLLLTCVHGLSPREATELQRSDIAHTGDTVTIGASHHITLTATPDDPRGCPVAVYLRWARLQTFHDRRPNNKSLADVLGHAEPVDDDSLVNYESLSPVDAAHDGPLLPRFDQWGHAALRRHDRRGLSTRAITGIIGAHLFPDGAIPAGRSARSARLAQRWADEAAAAVEEAQHAARAATASVNIPKVSADELQARYEEALATKRADVDQLRDLNELFDDLDTRTDELLRRTAQLLDAAG